MSKFSPSVTGFLCPGLGRNVIAASHFKRIGNILPGCLGIFLHFLWVCKLANLILLKILPPGVNLGFRRTAIAGREDPRIAGRRAVPPCQAVHELKHGQATNSGPQSCPTFATSGLYGRPLFPTAAGELGLLPTAMYVSIRGYGAAWQTLILLTPKMSHT